MEKRPWRSFLLICLVIGGALGGLGLHGQSTQKKLDAPPVKPKPPVEPGQPTPPKVPVKPRPPVKPEPPPQPVRGTALSKPLHAPQPVVQRAAATYSERSVDELLWRDGLTRLLAETNARDAVEFAARSSCAGTLTVFYDSVVAANEWPPFFYCEEHLVGRCRIRH